MSGVTQILGQIEEGDGKVAEKLLPLVYDELRKLTAAKMTQENPGRWRWCMSCAAFLSFMHVLRRSAMSTESVNEDFNRCLEVQPRVPDKAKSQFVSRENPRPTTMNMNMPMSHQMYGMFDWYPLDL